MLDFYRKQLKGADGMFEPASFGLFLVTCAIAVITPGPDTLLVLSNTFGRGRRAGFSTALGVCSGYLVHITAAILGLTAIVLASAVLFTALKLCGAIYLIYLGIRSLQSRGGFSNLEQSKGTASGSFVQGFLGNVLNPKAIIFFIAFIPQFIEPQRGNVTLQVIVLGAITIAMCLTWYTGVVLLASQIRTLLTSRPKVVAWLNRITGSLLIALGIRLVVVERRTS
ncbi:MAG: LysE family translocator [Leptolyngbyaceae cyanobacterium SM1_3_5]|nr:LysE family translocator [Leptolyngbyaceae cyanobacterium SM1_3_5]